MIIVHREYPKRLSGLLCLGIFMIVYVIWMFLTRYVAGRWAYPILDKSTYLEMTIFFIFAGSFPFWLYFLGEYLNRKIWSKTRIAINCNQQQQKLSG